MAIYSDLLLGTLSFLTQKIQLVLRSFEHVFLLLAMSFQPFLFFPLLLKESLLFISEYFQLFTLFRLFKQ